MAKPPITPEPVKAPILNTGNANQWFKSVLANPVQARQLKQDWIKLLTTDLAATSQQKENLSLVPANYAKELQGAIAQVVDQGGTIHLDRESEHSPGTLIVEPTTPPGEKAPHLSIGIYHCTFDANCRNWHCGWGPAKKK
jgi:hypothetical protein